MNKYRYGILGASLGILCLGGPALAQETQTDNPSLLFNFKNTVPPGEFKITPAQPQGSFLIEANKAPLESVLQAIARLANRKLIISDEAQITLQGRTIVTFNITPMTPKAAFALFAGSFSWGTVGEDTFLLVTRKKSMAEIAAEKADHAIIEEKLLAPQPERAPDGPEQAHPTPRFYLLSPDAEQNQ